MKISVSSLRYFFEEIGLDIYKSDTNETFFPLNLICQILEFHSFEQDFDIDWVINFLRETVKVTYYDLFSTYKELFEHYFGYGSSSDEFDSKYEIPKKDKIRIFKTISLLVFNWIDFISNQMNSSERNDFPINEIYNILTNFESQISKLNENEDTRYIKDYLKKSKNMLSHSEPQEEEDDY